VGLREDAGFPSGSSRVGRNRRRPATKDEAQPRNHRIAQAIWIISDRNRRRTRLRLQVARFVLPLSLIFGRSAVGEG